MGADYRGLPEGLVAPVDDGAADGLAGRRVPAVGLPSTLGGEPDLAALSEGLLVAYVYPMTGTPGVPLPDGWDAIPGARGCTPQSCAFRDHYGELRALGAEVVGISTQSPEAQREFTAREHIPYAVLSDESLALARELGLPTFEVEGRRLHKRLTFIARGGVVEKVFYPVFPPDRNAADVLAWLLKR